ncbi:MAG: ABC transporter permease [Candidatus Heimdallarchaeota archaeon]
MTKPALIITRKEIKLLFKSPRRIFLLFATPLVFLLIFGISFFLAMSQAPPLVEPDAFVEVIIIQADPGYNESKWGDHFYSLLKENDSRQNLKFVNKSVTDLDSLLTTSNFSILLYIPSNLSELISKDLPAQCFLYYDNSNPNTETAVSRIINVAASLNQELLHLEYGNPLNLNRFFILPEGTSEAEGPQVQIASFLTLIPLYAMFLFVFPPLGLVLISVTMEREQKTLESLILQPVRRKTIITGKIFYGVILVLFNTFLFVLSFLLIIIGIYQIIPEYIKRELPLMIENLIASIDLSVWLFLFYILIGVILISVLFITGAVLLSLMAKDEREANMVMSMIFLIPFFAIMFLVFLPLNDLPDFIQMAVGAIPVLGYFYTIHTILRGGVLEIWAWIILAVQGVWIAITVWFTGRMIESEGILEISFKKILRLRRGG